MTVTPRHYATATPSSTWQLTPRAGGLQFLNVTTEVASARVCTQGAHLESFQPATTQHPVLFISSQAAHQPGTAIRGGVPVIFPWFGPHPQRSDLPAHGLVRTRTWNLDSATEQPDHTMQLVWSIQDGPDTRRDWPFAFRLRLEMSIGEALSMTLAVENRSDCAFIFEAALHTYLQVSDVRNVSVRGLAGREYLDEVDSFARKTEINENISITGETDRIYLDTTAPVFVDDPGFARTIEVAKSGSNTTVLWNPWIRKSASLPDFGNDEWPYMLCIETANAAENAVLLAPGAIHQMTAIVRTHPFTG